jgi:hypothetical protein
MQHHNKQWNIILPWMLATMAGVVLGILSLLTLATGLALAGTSTVLVGLIGGAGLGGGIGIAQWLVLRRHIASAGWWVLVSVVGGMIGVALGLVLSDALRPLISTLLGEAIQSRPTGPRLALSNTVAVGAAGAVVGVILGSAQWLVLRRHVRSAGRWIVASCLGWMAGLSLSAGMIDVLGIPLSLLAIGVVSGAATGVLLAYLLSGGAAPFRRATVT